MKRLTHAVILLLGLSMATMMTSCTKDNSQMIVGNWELTEDTWIHLGNMYAVADAGMVFKFTADGFTTFPTAFFSVNYELEGNTLIIGDDGFNIDKLTNSTMILSSVKHPDDAQIVLKKVE